MNLTTRQLDVKTQKLQEQLLLIGGTIRQTETQLAELEIQAGRIEGGVLMLRDFRKEVVQMDEAAARKAEEDAEGAKKIVPLESDEAVDIESDIDDLPVDSVSSDTKKPLPTPPGGPVPNTDGRPRTG